MVIKGISGNFPFEFRQNINKSINGKQVITATTKNRSVYLFRFLIDLSF